ncbi:MAG: ribosome small subunit-dependent GTPase A [Planctomycetota bacterium]|nr:ribosome small subunit-dependent GTPase A [Planctomycetota bacterium]
MSETLNGVVTRIAGLASTVDCGERGIFTCDFRGRLFRKQNLRLAVGDRVSVLVEDAVPGSPDSEDQDPTRELRGVIEKVEKRRSSLRRPRESKRDQVLCANIDHVFVVTSVFDPVYKKGFIDRVLVAVERERLQATLIFNKIDLLQDDDHFALLLEDLAVYRDLGYEMLFVSADSGYGLKDLQALLKDTVSVFTGPSGVGKSTLLNKLCPGLQLRTGDVGKSGKGRHVTTSAILLKLAQGGFVVDTPGVRAFGISGLKPEDLATFFRDIREIQSNCRFRNCRHCEEPGCAVLEAVDEGELSLERYESYMRIYDDLVSEKARSPRKSRTLGRPGSS